MTKLPRTRRVEEQSAKGTEVAWVSWLNCAVSCFGVMKGDCPSPWEYQRLFTGKELSSWEESGALEFLHWCATAVAVVTDLWVSTKGKRQYMLSLIRPVPSIVSAHHPSAICSTLRMHKERVEGSPAAWRWPQWDKGTLSCQAVGQPLWWMLDSGW